MTGIDDSEWKKVYNDLAVKEKHSEAKMSFWTDDGFNTLQYITYQLVDNLPDVKNVLDVGCGPGTYCRKLSKKGYNVTGLDYSEEMIKFAKNKDKKINFLVGDAYDLPFKKNSFDLVICIGVITCLSDFRRVISELKRVSSKHIILSTLLRSRSVMDVDEYIARKFRNDPWPTIEYLPSELIPYFTGYSIEVITHIEGELIPDGFFLVCSKK